MNTVLKFKSLGKKLTVGEMFLPYGLELPEKLASETYDGSKQQLLKITEHYVTGEIMSYLYKAAAPTPSAIEKERKDLARGWWHFLVHPKIGVDEADKALRRAIENRIKVRVDECAHKFLTGHELPKSKDGYSHNTLQALRAATGQGDAAIFLYRIKYWWPKASVIILNKYWIAKTHKQWADELGMETRSFRTAYDRLVKLDLIEKTVADFRGASINHIRPTEKAEKLFAEVKNGGTD